MTAPSPGPSGGHRPPAVAGLRSITPHTCIKTPSIPLSSSATLRQAACLPEDLEGTPLKSAFLFQLQFSPTGAHQAPVGKSTHRMPPAPRTRVALSLPESSSSYRASSGVTTCEESVLTPLRLPPGPGHPLYSCGCLGTREWRGSGPTEQRAFLRDPSRGHSHRDAPEAETHKPQGPGTQALSTHPHASLVGQQSPRGSQVYG